MKSVAYQLKDDSLIICEEGNKNEAWIRCDNPVVVGDVE